MLQSGHELNPSLRRTNVRMQKKEYSVEVGGKTLIAVFSDLAEQAHGSVMLRYGETIVLATACMSKDKEEGKGFFNLTVDYVERFYAAGKILGSRFVHREGRPSEDAVLAGRVIDRTLRPLFDRSMGHAVQVIVTVISLNEEDPVVLAVNAASLALAVSDIPWHGPVGAVRIGRYDSEAKSAQGGSPDASKEAFRELKVNPVQGLRADEEKYQFDLVVCGRGGHVNMIEASAHETKEEEIKEALERANVEITKLEDFQKKIVKEISVPKRIIEKEKVPDELVDVFNKEILPKMEPTIFVGPSLGQGEVGKKQIDELHSVWNKMVRDYYREKNSDRVDFFAEDELFDGAENAILHEKAINGDQRADGRRMNELRDIYAQAGGVSSVLHGSGIFYRGGTHVLSVLTLAGPEARLVVDGMETTEERRFMHHYNFPPYSSGEVGRMGATNRREIGHGALVEKALAMVLPSVLDFPYTMRLVSESLASNGSTSQAAICASTLALMDGGVPIRAPVAGVAMGLMYESDSKYKILTDIQGPEDHHGDMDFKIAGTRTGVTAIQLDVKVAGIPVEILFAAMLQARTARGQILDVMQKEISAPRPQISPNAPRILVMRIKPDQIGMVIGTGGKTIKDITEKTGAEITIEDNGTVYLSGKGDTAERARRMIEEMTHEFKVGEVLQGEVVKLADFGVFVRLNSFTDGMVHISELAPFRVDRVSDIIKEGMIVPVRVLRIDEERGKISLSIKEADRNFFPKDKQPAGRRSEYDF